jgi:hypothetical protein
MWDLLHQNLHTKMMECLKYINEHKSDQQMISDKKDTVLDQEMLLHSICKTPSGDWNRHILKLNKKNL